MWKITVYFVSGRECIYSFAREQDVKSMKNSLVSLMHEGKGCYWMRYWDEGREDNPDEIVINPAHVEQVTLTPPK